MEDAYEHYQTGVALMASGDFLGAVTELQASVAAVPHFKTLERLGECLVELGRLREAVVPLAAATTLNRGVRAPALLAEVFWNLDERHDAETLADIALARDPNNRKAQNVRRMIAQLPPQVQPDEAFA